MRSLPHGGRSDGEGWRRHLRSRSLPRCGERRNPPARPLGQMAFARLRPPHPLGPELDAQPVDQPRQLALRPTAPRPGCPAPRPGLRPSRRSARRRRSRTPGRAPPLCRPAGAGDASARGWGSRSRPTPRRRCRRPGNRSSASRRAPSRRSSSCRTSAGISRSSAWAAASGWVAGSSSRSEARGGGSAGAAVSGSACGPSPVERIERIVRLAEPPRQRQPRHARPARRWS